jgi:hypothetical protein
MATINLLNLTPHKVSTDLSGYITYIYGSAKTGKTTLATQAPGALLLAFERGYNALPGVIAQDITSWSDVKAVVRELKKPEVKNVFKTIILDTIDLAGVMCEKYICAQQGVDKIGELPYGQGWNLMKREFEDVCRAITQQGYALFFISHDKDRVIKDDKGNEIVQIFPSCPSSFNDIAKNAADIYGYAQKYRDEEGNSQVRLILRSSDGNIDAGCRFKYIKPVINFTYKDLVEALTEAIEKEAVMNNNQYVTSERETVVTKELNYDALMQEFTTMAQELMTKDQATYAPKITSIINKYLGKNKKISEATPEQVELVKLIVDDVREDLYNKK